MIMALQRGMKTEADQTAILLVTELVEQQYRLK